MSAAFPADVFAEIKACLPLHRLIGETVALKRTGKSWRGDCVLCGGKSSSFSVYGNGYKCFSCGEKGDVFTWTMWRDRVGLVEAVHRLAADAGVTLPGEVKADDPAEVERQARERAEREDRLAELIRQRDADNAAARAYGIADARADWDSAGSLEGSLAERYLTATRGIARPATGWPDCLRYLAAKKMLVAAGTDADSAVQFVHRLYLRADGTNVRRPDGTKRKMTRGPMDNAAIRLPGDGDTLHAEGLETGLSAWVATGQPVMVYCGPVASRMIPQSGRNVVLRDDDPVGLHADKLLIAAMRRWRDAGIDFAVAQPWPDRRGDKTDFNDTLKEGGPDAVAARIDAADANCGGTGDPQKDPPPGWDAARPARGNLLEPLQVPWVAPPPGTVPLVEVQAAITGLTSKFFTNADAANRDARARKLRAEAVEAEEKARAREVKARGLMNKRLAQRDALVVTIQDRLATGEPMRGRRAKARRAKARKAEHKARRACTTWGRHRDKWFEAKAKLTPPIYGPPLAIPYVVNAAETGTQKTGITLKMAAAWIDTRKAAGLGHRIIALVPALRPDIAVEPDAATMAAFNTGKASERQRKRVVKYLEQQRREKDGTNPHGVKRLGQQMLDRARDIGINAAVFLGMGDSNCRHIDAVDLAKLAGADPSKAVCGNANEGCAALRWCMAAGYKHNVVEATNADLVIVAHNFLTEKLPPEISAGAWAVIIDEEFATQPDIELDLNLESLGREAIEKSPVLNKDGTPDPVATEMLVERLATVADAARRSPGQYLSDDALMTAGSSKRTGCPRCAARPGPGRSSPRCHPK